MSFIDSFTDATLELYNIERNILMRMLKRQGISITAEELRNMAREEQQKPSVDHPYEGDPDDIRFSIEKYDE